MRAFATGRSAGAMTLRHLREKTAALARRRGTGGTFYVLHLLLVACYVSAIVYVCASALGLGVTNAPSWFRWFGAPGSQSTIAVVLAIPLCHFVLRWLAGKAPLSDSPLIVIAAMAVSAVVLGMSAYWRCHGDQTRFFAPLAWTLGLFVGSVEQPFGQNASTECMTMPVALEIARLLAIATTLATASAAALTLFRTQLDRIATWRAQSLTVVVGVDDETLSMIRAIAGTLARGETLVVFSDDAQSSFARVVRSVGAKIRVVDLAQPEAMSRMRLWNRVDRLYLLSADPVQNLKCFKVIDEQVAAARGERVRLPLTVRIDDPWQAEVWRRSFLAAAKGRWIGDAVGRFEITATKLARHMATKHEESDEPGPPTTVVLCGLYPLTYALASELAQLQRDQELYSKPHITQPTSVVIFAQGAQSFAEDHQLRQGRMAPDGTALPVLARDDEPTVDAISAYLRGAGSESYAVVLGDPSMETHGTRLAARFPRVRVYLASDVSTSLVDFSIVGRLYGFPINMELDKDAPQDVWERAAELIHEHFSSGTDRIARAAKPWNELDPFYKQSNRRQVLNTLWMVETLAGHTWNSLEWGPATPLPGGFAEMDPPQQLRILGFDDDTVEAMVRIEHEDWCRYYRGAGWKYAEQRNDDRLRHNKLLPWDELVAIHPEFVVTAQKSLISTLVNLRNLGYRSVPKAVTSQGIPLHTEPVEPAWRRYRRRGEVSAERRGRGWTWTTPTGELMHARAGDWAVTDDDGHERSVAAEVFELMHEQIAPRRYRRSGAVLARRATRPEVIRTLEGDAEADEGDWIVQGPQGEEWPVPDEQFRDSYEEPHDA